MEIPFPVMGGKNIWHSFTYINDGLPIEIWWLQVISAQPGTGARRRASHAATNAGAGLWCWGMVSGEGNHQRLAWLV